MSRLYPLIPKEELVDIAIRTRGYSNKNSGTEYL